MPECRILIIDHLTTWSQSVSKVSVTVRSLWAALLFSTAVSAVTPSPAMIEQFKQLPAEQQKQLAAQYGIDMNQLNAQGAQTEDAMQAADPQLQLSPRARAAQQEEQFNKPEQELIDGKPVLKRFGLQMFDSNISTFAPVSNLPVPDDYVLGAGDSINVQLYGKENDSTNLQLNREGVAQLDDIGPLQLAGLTFAEASKVIKAKVAEAKIGVEAAVSMGKMRTINVFIAGEAKFPGMYSVSALTTVTQALYVAGGISDIGSLRDIRINRAGKQVGSFDLYQLLLEGNNSGDINLKHGDVLFVAPMKGQVTIDGLVNRPAVYEIKGGETVQQLVTMAGGHKANAHLKAVSLQRVNQSNLKDLKTLDLTASNDNGLSLRDGDLLTFNAISERVENEVVLAGAFVRPGRYAYRTGMQVSDLIKGVWADLQPTVDLDYALVVREKNSKGDLDVVQINLAEVLGISPTRPGKKAFVLQPRDVILAFHYSDTEAEEKEALKKEQQQKKGLVETETKLPSVSFKAAFSNEKFLTESSTMTRRQLLQPVLEHLKRQSTTSDPLKIVSITGEVKMPGEYPIGENTTLTQALVAAGGITDAAFTERAEVSRYLGFDAENAKYDIKNLAVNISAIQANTEQDLVLQSRDRINVFAKPEWAEERTVKIDGEVKFPGTYQVARGETLSQLIERAGGFTQNAFPFGAVFTREKIQQREQAQFDRLLVQLKSDIATKSLTSQTSLPTSADQSMALINQLGEQKMVGRLVVNMSQIQAGNPEYDLELEQGDTLVIPRKNAVVSVLGEVQNPGSHSFDPNLSVKDYLALSGNGRKRSDQDRIYVLRADGSVFVPSQAWFGSSETLMAGDTIIVPLDVEYKDSLSLWSQVTQIFYQSAVALAAVNSF